MYRLSFFFLFCVSFSFRPFRTLFLCCLCSASLLVIYAPFGPLCCSDKSWVPRYCLLYSLRTSFSCLNFPLVSSSCFTILFDRCAIVSVVGFAVVLLCNLTGLRFQFSFGFLPLHCLGWPLSCYLCCSCSPLLN